jgi:hypothetical protein
VLIELMGAAQVTDQTCERCEAFEEVHDAHCPDHPDHDPTPWCSFCGAQTEANCDCGPIADSE